MEFQCRLTILFSNIPQIDLSADSLRSIHGNIRHRISESPMNAYIGCCIPYRIGTKLMESSNTLLSTKERAVIYDSERPLQIRLANTNPFSLDGNSSLRFRLNPTFVQNWFSITIWLVYPLQD